MDSMKQDPPNDHYNQHVHETTEGPECLHALDKGELHVHLNGALPAATIRDIVTAESTEIPLGFDLNRDLVRNAPSSSLAEYLTPWQILRRIPKRLENLQRLIDSAVAALAAHRVRFVELRSSVLYLATLHGSCATKALERLIISTGVATERHGMRRGLVLTVTRGDYSAVHLADLLNAYKALGEPRDIVGIDLAGNEEIPYPAELPMLFREAKQRYGLGITVHAGETGQTKNIRDAVELFGADRIGHGTAAGRDPRLMELLAKRDICVEVCPISNRLTGAVPPDAAHPLHEFQRHGVPFVICSDNPGIHQRGLSDDYTVAMAEGVSLEDIKKQYALAKHYSFITEL